MTDTAEQTATDVEVFDGPRADVDVSGIIAGLNTGVAYFSTVTGDDIDSRMLVLDALIDPQPIVENVGKTINLQHFIVQPVELADQNSGEVVTAPRVVLIDADGTGYVGTSVGLLSSLRNILAALGDIKLTDLPGGGLPIAVSQQRSRNNAGTFFTIKRVRSTKK